MSDGAFLLGFILFFFVVWVASGGPNHPISFAGPYITPITTVGVTQTGYGDPITGINIGAARTDLFSIQRSVTGLKKEVQDAKLFGEASPYKGMVTISWGNNLGTTDPNQEYITIKAAYNAQPNINISGWKLVAVSNDRSVTIPYGQELLSRTNTNTGPIILHPNETAVIVTGKSPVDVSFRENMCAGYYTQSKTFYPYLSQTCPDPSDEYETFYTGNEYKDGDCESFVATVNRCNIPSEKGKRLSSSCYQFIDKYLNYQGCIDAHRGDARFWGNSWRIYLGREPLTKSHDDTRRYGDLWKSSKEAIKLVDQNGKTVDLYQY
ncbi:MAG: hypothetical protein AB202_03225 [Parcubacteria bacterium C7867-007]|nr:MAG: hypothetical protein AB202_03225 [Parcubacteria bacterium C7867-007]